MRVMRPPFSTRGSQIRFSFQRVGWPGMAYMPASMALRSVFGIQIRQTNSPVVFLKFEEWGGGNHVNYILGYQRRRKNCLKDPPQASSLDSVAWLNRQVESENETRKTQMMKGKLSGRINRRCRRISTQSKMYRKWTSYVSPSRSRLRTTMKIGTRVHAGLVCLVLLSSVQVSALDCNFLKHRQKVFNLQSLELWREMSTTFSPECLKKPTTFNFPTKILEIRESQPATEAIYEILRGFFHILSSDSLKTVWKVTHRERWVSALHDAGVGGKGWDRMGQQKERFVSAPSLQTLPRFYCRSLQMLHAHTKVLKSCLGGKKSTPGKLEERRNKLELKKYFRRIRTFLRVNGGSTCCWECLQHEVRSGLMYVDILTKRMRRQQTSATVTRGTVGAEKWQTDSEYL